MPARPTTRSYTKLLDTASMIVLLFILGFFFFKERFAFEDQKWIYLVLGIVLVIVDALRIYFAWLYNNRRMLIWRSFTLLLVVGFLGYWLYVRF
jgi:glucose uptake protein GlcU